MVIRRANVNDVGSMARIHRRSILELCSTHYSDEQLNAWISVLHESAYQKLVSTHEVFVAEEHGELLGFCVLDLKAGFINATYLSPNAIRRGIGRELMTAAETAARSQSLNELRLNATLNSVGFYERLGYLRGALASNRLPTGEELPCVTMSKLLGD